MKNISGVTEEVAKKSLKNITLGILTLGGYNLYSAFNFTSETGQFYDRYLERCASNILKDCPADRITADPNNTNQKICLVNPIKLTNPNLLKNKEPIQAYTSQVAIPCKEIAGGKCPNQDTGPAAYIARLYTFGLMIAGAAAFGMIIFGGFKYVLAAGNLASTQEAKETITGAIWGLLLLLMAYVILYTINPRLVNVQDPNAPTLFRDFSQEASIDQPNQLLPAIEPGIKDPNCRISIQVDLTTPTIGDPNNPNGKPILESGRKSVCAPWGCNTNSFRTIEGICECNLGFAPDADGICAKTLGPEQNRGFFPQPNTQ
ncbi:MAG TPA: pilin [Candidatus Paceibacterota bacterium]